MNKRERLIEILKEALRNAVLGAVSYLLTEGLISSVVMLVVGDRLDVQVVLLVSAGLTWVLRGVEKQLHKAEKVSLPF